MWFKIIKVVKIDKTAVFVNYAANLFYLFKLISHIFIYFLFLILGCMTDNIL